MTDVRAYRLTSVALAGIAALLAAPAHAAPVSATGTASVDTVNSLVVVPNLDLAFGLLKGGDVAGSATVRPQGLRSVASGGEMVSCSARCRRVLTASRSIRIRLSS